MKRILAMILALVMVLGLCACGGDEEESKGKTTINFMIGGSVEVSSMFRELAKEFNATAGEELGINVKVTDKGSGLSSVLSQQLPSNSGPDVVIMQDEYFKTLTKYLEDLNPHIDENVLTDFYPAMANRYRYDIDTNTSNPTDPLYAIPVFSDAAVLFYNKTAIEAAGVICISVPADQIEAFNGGAADLNGKTKSDYGITIDIPAKGYYRSDAPFVPGKGEIDGSSWEMPSRGEVLVFNDQIAMNWDEIEDLGMLCTKEFNSSAQTKYGYYTEWWFNYSWSVGGDCIEDVSGNGDWKYTHPSDIPNYIVTEGNTFTGSYTGNTYTAGQTLDVKDVLDVNKGDVISIDTDGKTYMNFVVNGQKVEGRDYSAEISDGILQKLPSTAESFGRFVNLAGKGGLNICPTPSTVGSSTPLYFTSGTLALMMERVSFCSYVESTMRDEWGIAPLPQYKLYEDPEDPDNTEIVAQGISVGHSHGYSLGVSAKSKNKDAAYAFANWMANEGQEYMARNGYVSSRQSLRDTVAENMTQKNVDVLLDTVAVAEAGDWWYMPSRGWIDSWASDLNYTVRYGGMSLEEFLYKNIESCNNALDSFKE